MSGTLSSQLISIHEASIHTLCFSEPGLWTFLTLCLSQFLAADGCLVHFSAIQHLGTSLKPPLWLFQPPHLFTRHACLICSGPAPAMLCDHQGPQLHCILALAEACSALSCKFLLTQSLYGPPWLRNRSQQ